MSEFTRNAAKDIQNEIHKHQESCGGKVRLSQPDSLTTLWLCDKCLEQIASARIETQHE